MDRMPRRAPEDLAQVLGMSFPGGERWQPEGGRDQLQRGGVLERTVMDDSGGSQVGHHDGRDPEPEGVPPVAMPSVNSLTDARSARSTWRTSSWAPFPLCPND